MVEEANTVEFIKRYLAGESINKISAQSGCSDYRVRAILVEHNIKLRSRTESLYKPFPDFEGAVALYQAGNSIKSIAKTVSLSPHVIAARFRMHGIKIRPTEEVTRKMRTRHFPTEVTSAIVQRYLCGESPAALAEAFDFFPGRSPTGRKRATGIRRIIVEAGVQLRTESESHRLLWKGAPMEKRRKQVRIAQLAGSKRRLKDMLNVAPEEYIVADALRERGMRITQQRSVDVYNLDISFDEVPVAVEIERGSCFTPSLRPKLDRRVKYLVDRGWWVLHIVTGRRRLNIPMICDKVIAFAEAARLHKTSIGKYGVIDCQGNAMTGPRFQLNTLPRIPSF